MSDLTAPQVYWLRSYTHGWTIGDPTKAPAPIRRLIKRGLIAKTGMWRNRPYFKITDAGLRALKDHPHV